MNHFSIDTRPILICIVGPSGAGKTTLANHIASRMGIPSLVSYTTRPKREGETEGVEHHFVSEEQMPSREEMLAYTYFGGNHYWVPLTDVLNERIYTYVIDEKGLMELLSRHHSSYRVYSILVLRDVHLLIDQVGEDRVRRDLNRIHLSPRSFQNVIENNGGIEEFLNTGIETVKTILQL